MTWLMDSIKLYCKTEHVAVYDCIVLFSHCGSYRELRLRDPSLKASTSSTSSTLKIQQNGAYLYQTYAIISEAVNRVVFVPKQPRGPPVCSSKNSKSNPTVDQVSGIEDQKSGKTDDK
jgi:hypothetical protein